MSQTLDPLNEGADNHHGGEGEIGKNGRSNSGERNKLGGGQMLLQLNGNGTAMEQQPILKKRDQNGNLSRRSTGQDGRCSTKVDFEEIVSS